MKIGIGIDTGGTFTDAAAYDFSTGEVLAGAKAPTTKEDLAVGIGGALDKLPPALLEGADMVALSTTLATNACVENKGGRVGLVLIGADSRLLNEVGSIHGLPPANEILYVNAQIMIDGTITVPPDWALFLSECGEWIGGKQAVAVVQFGAKNSGAQLEKKAKALLMEHFSLPVVCGHELFTDLNMMRRAASALLNARLLPVIQEFLLSVRRALEQRGIKKPIVIVRSDGTLMSEQFAAMRPVETLLCGPAASVMFGANMAEGKTSIIVDMGGTTSDVAMIKNGLPLRAKHGIDIGQWKTFVKGMFIHTFGLGGDSAVRYDKQFRLTLGPGRVVPLSALAQGHPEIKETLKELSEKEHPHTMPLHEFFFLAKPPEGKSWSPQELDFCAALKDGPLPFAQAAARMGSDLYNFHVDRLEAEGVVSRAGLTPTDIMHLKGDFDSFDKEAAQLGAQAVAHCVGMNADALCDTVYEMVKKKLYCELVEMMLSRRKEFAEARDAQIVENISLSWDAFMGRSTGFAAPRYSTPATLVGLGAPIHVFLADVAKALHTDYVIPPHAAVANAVGALVGNVSCEYEIGIGFHMGEDGRTTYVVHGVSGNTQTQDLDEAIELAKSEALKAVEDEARLRGAQGELKLSVKAHNQNAYTADGAEIYLGSSVTARAIGKIGLGISFTNPDGEITAIQPTP